MSIEYTEKVPGILLDEFDKQDAMRKEGIVVAVVTQQDDWFGIQIRFRAFGSEILEVGTYPAIKQEEVTDDKIREMVAEGLRVIWELYEQKKAATL